MSSPQKEATSFDAMLSEWMKSVSEFWSDTTAAMPMAPGFPFQAEDRPGGNRDKKSRAAMTAAMKNLQSFATSLSTPESMTALLKGAGAMPEILAQIAGSSVSSFIEAQRKMAAQALRIREVGKAYRFEDLDENFFQVWNDIYERELKRFFYIPQIGLTRGYQEQWNQAMDKFNVFQTRLGEFLRLLGMPFHRSLTLLQEEISTMAEAGDLPEDTQVYYQMWIKVLEGHFMTLFQEPEYVRTLSTTISALADYAAARDAVFEEMIRMLPVARRSELDDLAREVHRLKRRIRTLEKENKQMRMAS